MYPPQYIHVHPGRNPMQDPYVIYINSIVVIIRVYQRHLIIVS